MRRPYGVKGSVYVVTLPAFQRCLKDGPDAAERRPGSGFPTGRGTGDGHLEAHHDLQATPARPGEATRSGVRRSIVPAAPRTSYSSFFKAGGRDLFSATEKNGADFTRHNLTIHPIPMICARCYISALESYTGNNKCGGLHFHYFFQEPRPHQSTWWNALLSQRDSFLSEPLSKREDSVSEPAEGE